MTDSTLRTFGGRLKLMRTAADLTQDDLAVEVGLTRASIANMERGSQDPPLTRLTALAAALACPVGVLVGEADDERLDVARRAAEDLERIAGEMARLEQERQEVRCRFKAGTRCAP